MSQLVERTGFKIESTVPKKKKNKEKKSKTTGHVQIIDDDAPVPWSATATKDEAVNDELVSFEDAPVVVGIVDERPKEVREKERFNDMKRWRAAAFEEVPPPEAMGPHPKPNKTSSQRERKTSDDSDPEVSRRRPGANDDDPDLSPPRRGQRRNKIDDDPSPARRRRNQSDDDPSPPRKRDQSSSRNRNEDRSPPRRRRNHSDDDRSPPRRKKAESDEDPSPPRRKKNHSDDDHSPPRRRKTQRDDDRSPPRRKKAQSDDDPSPPRRKIKMEDDPSPPRRKHKHQDDRSPPRRHDRHRMKEEPVTPRVDRRPVRRESPPPKEERRSKQESTKPTSAEPAKSERRRLAEEKEKVAERYALWGRGVAQVKQAEEQIKDFIEISQKPLARYRDDKDLDVLLKNREREDDPMLKYLTPKPAEESGSGGSSAPPKPRYRGPDPQKNRFDIWPGYRWDGVDRSNGYERRLFESIATRHAKAQEAYLWSVEDM